MKSLPALLFYLLSSAYLFCQIPESPDLDRIFQDWNRTDAPGCAVSVVKDGQIIFKKGYGMADLEHMIPITPSSVFYIGSVSKQFVTFCILLLEEQGKIDLDDPIQKYLPDFPKYEAPLTIRHFIHHTSGVRDYLTLMSLKNRSYLDHTTIDEVYDLIKRQKVLNFTPGDRYLYSNSCYFMLAMIIEKAAGKSIREFAQQHIFGPLDMQNSLFYDDIADLVPNRVFSYEPDRENGGYDNLVSRFDLVGSGGVYSTVEDLYLWDQNFYKNKLGKGGQEIINRMHEEGQLNNGESSGYAFALNNGEYKGLKTVSHGGALAGYRAQLLRFPDQSFSVIILANRGDADPTGRAFQIADLFLKDEFTAEEESDRESEEESQTVIDESEFEIEQITGRYHLRSNIIVRVTREKESLHAVQLWDNSTSELLRLKGNLFGVSSDSTTSMTFSKLENGKSQTLFVDMNGAQFTFNRLPDEHITEAQMRRYAGDYYSEELDVNYTIMTEGQQLKVKIADASPIDLVHIEGSTFTSNRGTIRFDQSKNKIDQFVLDAGRVRNLSFKKL